MAGSAFLNRLRRRAPEPSDGKQETPPPAQARPAEPKRPPTPGQLRRERRALVRAREERIRDLGGLLLEMVKRNQFRQELFFEQCREIISMEERIAELDDLLAAATRRTLAEANRCTCGAPIVWGAHFCANCGRPVGESPVVACAHCGNPLPADASFCMSCGRPAEPAEPRAAEPQPSGEETEATMATGEGSREAEAPGRAADPWER